MRCYLARIAGLLLLTVSISACGQGGVEVRDDHQLRAHLNRLSTSSVYFGHQSVGANMLAGVREMIAELDVGLIIQPAERNSPIVAPGIYESRIGENRAPLTKITDFANTVRSFGQSGADVAMMKFCYVDTTADADPDTIFAQYVEQIERLENEFPETTFVYMTMPLTSPSTDLRNRVRQIFGRMAMIDSGKRENLARNRFNELLRAAKGATGRLFDVASVQSTKPDGSDYLVDVDGNAYEALYHGYTYDGGHLNRRGRYVLARELISFLATVDMP